MPARRGDVSRDEGVQWRVTGAARAAVAKASGNSFTAAAQHFLGRQLAWPGQEARMSPEAHACLVDLDAASRDALAFYQYAAIALPSSATRECCLRMEKAKGELVALLALRLGRGRQRGIRALRGASPLRDRLAPAFAHARSELQGSPAGCHAAIERIEATLLDACQRAAGDSHDADCRRLMAWALPMLQRGRDEFGIAARGP
jgi:hypothetical protein